MTVRINLRTDDDANLRLKSDSVNMSENIIVESTDYNLLENKPSIEGNELIGDKTLDELGINKDSLNITADSLGITSESLGITPESIGINSADTYSIYSLFHS